MASSAWRRLQPLHLLLIWRWAQMEALPQTMQMLLTRLCSQMEAPPQHMTPESTLVWLRKGCNPWVTFDGKVRDSGTTTG